MVNAKEVISASPVLNIITTASPANAPLIMVKNVSKSFRKKTVLKDVSFDVFPKDIFGLIGMSGSGKTTIFQLMAGIVSPEAGDVLVRTEVLKSKKKDSPDYLSVFRNPYKVKTNFGFASQIPSFYEHLTVEENLLMYASLYGMTKAKSKESASHLIKLVDLTSDKDTMASELSGGMQRRLDIACALIHNPKVLFLDEPTSDLDPLMRRQIWSLIRDINSRGTTVFLASHILEEVENLCTKVAILHEKRVLGYGTLKELRGLFKRNKQVKLKLESGNYDAITKKLNKEKAIERTVEKDGSLIVFVPSDEKVIMHVIKIIESSKEKLVSLDVSDATLTEIFETLTKRIEQQ